MSISPSTLTELRGRREQSPWLLDLVLPEIGGGRYAAADLDGVEVPTGMTALRVSGVDQDTFEVLVTGLGKRFSSLQFWKCPRIADLSPLEDLPHLKLVSFYWNQRATRLWDLARTPELKGLHFDDFTRLHDLSDLEAGASLTELEFGDAVWDQSVFDSLEPIADLRSLRSLKLSAKKVVDGRIEPLGQLTELESLSFSSKQFTTQQVAWLRARLPQSLQSVALDPLRRLSPPLERDGKVLDVLLVGKRKPFLNSVLDRPRIDRHLAEYQSLVERFRSDPSLLAD